MGHAHDERAKTGCTVIIPEEGAVGGIDIRGSAPGAREIESLKPVRLVPQINALFFTGGSAFGLNASGGVQQFLEEKGIGYDVGVAKIPIVPAAVIFDLREGDPNVRPDIRMGYDAAFNASSQRPLEGRVGAGCGATVGKIFGHQYRMKGGLGTCSDYIGDVCVGALSVVNAYGNVVDPKSGITLAGARNPETGKFLDFDKSLRSERFSSFEPATNTTLALVATDANLTKEEAIKVAQMAQDGLSRTIRPAHTPYDGDVVFCMSVGEKQGNVVAIGAVAADVVAEAIVRAVKIANNLD